MSLGNIMADASLTRPTLNSIRAQKLLILVVILGALLYGLINHDFGEIIIAAISDAYIQVTSFVAATLFLFYTIERIFKFNLMSRSRQGSSSRQARLEAVGHERTQGQERQGRAGAADRAAAAGA